MFIRVKSVAHEGRSYEYLQIVRSVRDGDRVRQELVASLGRRDLLVATGKLDKLLQALVRFSTRLKVVEAAKDERFVARAAKSGGRPGSSVGCGSGRACPRSWEDWPRGVASASTPSGWVLPWPCSASSPGLGPAGCGLGGRHRGAGVRCARPAPVLPHPAVAGGDPPGSRSGAVLQRPRPVLGRARPGLRRHHLGLPLP